MTVLILVIWLNLGMTIRVLTWSQFTFDPIPTSTEESLKNGWQLNLGMTIGVLIFSYSTGMTIGVLTWSHLPLTLSPLVLRNH